MTLYLRGRVRRGPQMSSMWVHVIGRISANKPTPIVVLKIGDGLLLEKLYTSRIVLRKLDNFYPRGLITGYMGGLVG